MRLLLFIYMLTSSVAFAGGLYNETKTPVNGEIITYRRSPRVEFVNPLNGWPVVTFVTDTVKLYPDGSNTQRFLRRTQLNAADLIGVVMPLWHPETGELISQTSVEAAYVMLYSFFRFSEQRQDLIDNGVASICYVTSGPVACP